MFCRAVVDLVSRAQSHQLPFCCVVWLSLEFKLCFLLFLFQELMLQFRSTEIGLLVVIFLFRPDVLLLFFTSFNLKVLELVCRAEESSACSQFCFLVLQPASVGMQVSRAFMAPVIPTCCTTTPNFTSCFFCPAVVSSFVTRECPGMMAFGYCFPHFSI